MEGIAKSAPTNATPVSVTHTTTQPVMLSGVPLTMIDYFGLDYRNIGDTEKRQLNDIYEYFRKPDGTTEDIYSGLRALEQKRGAGGENRIERLHRWIKISKQISDLQARRELI